MCFRAAISKERKNGVAEFYGSETPYGRMEAEDEEGKSRHVRDTWHGRKEKRSEERGDASPDSRVPIFSQMRPKTKRTTTHLPFPPSLPHCDAKVRSKRLVLAEAVSAAAINAHAEQTDADGGTARRGLVFFCSPPLLFCL